MTSMALFDDYLPEPEANPAQSRTESESIAASSPSSSLMPLPSSSVGRSMRLDPEGVLQAPSVLRELEVMPEEDEHKGDDDRTLDGDQEDTLSRSRPRAGSALSTPISINGGSLTPVPSQLPARSGHLNVPPQRQQHTNQHTPNSGSIQSQGSRKNQVSFAPGARIRNTPRLPNHIAEPAPSTVMYWSKAPVYGHLPNRAMRAHSLTLIDNLAWLVGGCDHLVCSRDILTFDTETMQWSHPVTVGDIPPPCRAHSATQVERRIFLFGGGEGPVYYNHLYVLDTMMRSWTNVTYPPDAIQPIARRAHATWYYHGKVYLFGGGNGAKALNDLWTLDTSLPYDKMEWVEVEVKGLKPRPRGYHTANLIGDSVVVIGGSDGSECFEDVWVLSLVRLTWHQIRPDRPAKRLSHTATQVGSYLFVMGGHDGSKYNHDLLLFNLVTLQWEPRETRGKYPPSRGYHATVLADSRLFVIGGFDGHNCFDDVYILDLAAAAYLPQVTSFNLNIN